jgi:hypothetical protein
MDQRTLLVSVKRLCENILIEMHELPGLQAGLPEINEINPPKEVKLLRNLIARLSIVDFDLI